MKDLKREAIAGITTFLTMSYIIVVNPAILATDGTGMSFSGVMTATILVSAVATLLMGLFAKLPFALAPGMGLNAFFTYSIILGEKIPWEQALGMVFWSGVFFVLLTLTPLREKIATSIPHNIKLGLAAGIGVFLTFIGLKNSELIKPHPVTFVTHGDLSFEVGATVIGLLIVVVLARKNNPLCYLAGIAFVTLTAVIFGKVSLPDQWLAWPDFGSVFMKVDIWGALKWAYLPSIFTLMVTDLFDSLSTFIGVSENAGLKDSKGQPKNIKQALFVDALATLFSSFAGTSPTTTYIESSAGTRAGGSTGLTSVITACCFLPFLFFGPLIKTVPTYATSAVLIVVGFYMFQSVSKMTLGRIEEALPVFLVVILIPLTFSITQGIVWGLFAHTVLFVITGRLKELSPTMLGLGLVSALVIGLG